MKWQEEGLDSDRRCFADFKAMKGQIEDLRRVVNNQTTLIAQVGVYGCWYFSYTNLIPVLAVGVVLQVWGVFIPGREQGGALSDRR